MMLGGAFSLAAITGWRIFYSSVVLQAMGNEGVLFLGSNPLVVEIARHIAANPDENLSVLGYLDASPNPALNDIADYLGPADRLRAIAEEKNPI
jgi:hypothetical protein